MKSEDKEMKKNKDKKGRWPPSLLRSLIFCVPGSGNKGSRSWNSAGQWRKGKKIAYQNFLPNFPFILLPFLFIIRRKLHIKIYIFLHVAPKILEPPPPPQGTVLWFRTPAKSLYLYSIQMPKSQFSGHMLRTQSMLSSANLVVTCVSLSYYMT